MSAATRESALGSAGLLVHLHDLDALLHEIQDERSVTRLRKLGFAVQPAERLRTVRARVAAAVDVRWRSVYDRVRARYGRGLAAVRDRVCTGCFVTLPTTARRPGADEHALTTCQGCGRILFWG